MSIPSPYSCYWCKYLLFRIYTVSYRYQIACMLVNTLPVSHSP